MTLQVDQDRFLALLNEHKRILYKVANAYCKNPENRLDLIQEIVIQLWRSYGQYDSRSQFSTWMYRIAMNVAISFYRSEIRRTSKTMPLEDLGFDIDVADQLLEQAGDDIRLLHQLINQLNELDRALIILYLDGYSHDDIADIVGISTTNVATKVSRIKQKLQRSFATA